MKKSNHVLYILGSIFTPIGVFFLIIAAIVFVNSSRFYSKAQSTEAIISDIVSTSDVDGERSYDVYVEYEAGGTKYDDYKLSYYSSNMNIGDSITVYYNSSNPSKIRTKAGSYLVLFILIPMGVIFAGVGFFLFGIAHHKKKKIKRLIETGRRIYVDVNDVVRNRRVRINARSPYVIECSWLDESTGKTYLFKSEDIWFDPTDRVSGIQLPAYVNPNNFKEHYIDISTMEEKFVNYR